MVVWLTQKRIRVVLAGIALFSGFILAEVWQLGYPSASQLIFFSCCLAALIGSGKQASP